MANYNITKTDGTPITVPNEMILQYDGSYTNGGLTVGLIGQNRVGYGTVAAQNTVNMLENFAGSAAPAGAVRGQLWFDMASGNTANNSGVLKVWTGADPTDNAGYNNTTDSAVMLSGWVQAGVQNITSTNIGTVGTPFVNLYVQHIFATDEQVQSIFIGDSNTGNGTTIDKDFYTPVPDSTNDTTGIRVGKTTNRFREVHTRNSFVHNQLNIGNQTNSQNVALLADNASNNTLIPGNSQVINFGTSSLSKRFGGFHSRLSDCLTLGVSDSVNEGLVSNLVPAIDNSYELGSSTARYANIHGAIVTADNIARQQVSSEVGSGANPFNAMYAITFNGVATNALYADLAERYESDNYYPVGTIVKIGGEKEITATTGDYDDFIGVISLKPAFLMNEKAGTDETHPAIALTGRIPVRVIGKVKKGQRIVVSDVTGVGRATSEKELCFVGFALGSKESDEEGLVEVVIGAK